MSDETTSGAPDLTQMSDEWWIGLRKHATDQVLKTGTTADLPAAGPAVLVTAVGAKTGLPRPVPLLRIEHEGRYVIAGTKGGSSREPAWTRNVRANPHVTLQDGDVTRSFIARELTGDERETWWQRAVVAQPAMVGYAATADRLIPLFVLDPA